VQGDASASTELRHALSTLGKEVPIDNNRVPAKRELDRRRRRADADDLVLRRGLGQPRIDPTVGDEAHEGVDLDVNALIERRGDQPPDCGLARS
jgi:hypothetical protein